MRSQLQKRIPKYNVRIIIPTSFRKPTHIYRMFSFVKDIRSKSTVFAYTIKKNELSKALLKARLTNKQTNNQSIKQTNKQTHTHTHTHTQTHKHTDLVYSRRDEGHDVVSGPRIKYVCDVTFHPRFVPGVGRQGVPYQLGQPVVHYYFLMI